MIGGRSPARLLLVAIVVGITGLGAVLAGLYLYAGAYGLHVLLRRGGSIWLAVSPGDARLSPAMRVALREPAPLAKAGPLTWTFVVDGFEAAELPVLSGGVEVDRLLLARIDPSRFRFIVRNAPAGDHDLGDWMRELGAALVVNGSYFAQDGTPDTPFLAAGRQLGPNEYQARHGAFVASPSGAAIVDLKDEDWHRVFDGAVDAMVSYPLLLAEDGSSRVKAGDRWLANRSFVAEDGAGRIVIGTTSEAFFSLERLAEFLRGAPLDLRRALNLDGGPLACQAIHVGDYRRDFCGKWELADGGSGLKLLQPLIGDARWALPIVLAVLPR